jgi:hypothetical protein
MKIHQDTPFQKAIEAAEALTYDDREELLEVLRVRLIEDRRDEIAANAKQVVLDVRRKRAEIGTVEDLKKDLLKD